MTIRIGDPPTPDATGYQVFAANFPGYVRHTTSLRKIQQRELNKLRRLSKREQRSHVRKLLQWRPMHELAAFNAVRAVGRLREATVATIAELAGQCDPFRENWEEVQQRFVRKRGQVRVVAAFGPLKRMHQLLVGDIVRALHPPRRDQYLYRGGMPAAFKAVEAAVRDGFAYGAEVDIVAFYSSVRLDGLAELLRPLPESVVRHVIWDNAGRAHGNADYDASSVSWAHPSLNRQPGLALGSASSPIVAERIIASLLSGDQCRTVAYADNIFVLGMSPEAVIAYQEALRERAEGFAGWRLRPRMEAVRRLSDGFEFLHHEAGSWDGAKFAWSPDQRKRDELRGAESEEHLNLDDIRAIEAKITHWRRAYPSWPEGDQWETRELAALAARRFFQEATPLNQSAAANALVASYFSSDRREPLEELTPEGTSADERRRRAELIEATRRRLVRIVELGRLSPEAVVPQM
jgi:hypothetical protein